MFRNAFGEPKPVNYAELDEAIMDVGLEPSACAADIYEPDPNEALDVFKGWTAEIRGDSEEGDMVELSTGGFESREALFDCLVKIGIPIRYISDAA